MSHTPKAIAANRRARKSDMLDGCAVRIIALIVFAVLTLITLGLAEWINAYIP